MLGRWGCRRKDGRRRRRSAALVLVVLTAAGSVVLTGGPARSVEQDANRLRQEHGHPQPEPRGERSARYPDPNDRGPRMPARFVAELDGRIVVVSANTGRVERYLTAGGHGRMARHPTVSEDGRTVWFSRQDGPCAAHLAFVPANGGREGTVPGSGDAGPEGLPLPRPDRAQVAYARGDCQDRHLALMIGDVEGREAHGQLGLLPLAWNRRGDQLLAVTSDGYELRRLDVDADGSIAAIDPLAPADSSPECRLTVIGFGPDPNNGYLAVRLCGGGGEARRSLVLLRRDGTLHRTLVRLPRGQKFVDHVAVDDGGHSLLYTTASSATARTEAAQAELTLWVWRDGEIRRLARHSPYRHPSWLP